MSSGYIIGLDEYYQPPDPPQFVPGEVSWAEALALDAYLSWYDDALDFAEIVIAVREQNDSYYKLWPELLTCEDEVSRLIEDTAKRIASQASKKDNHYEMVLSQLLGCADAYVDMVVKNLIVDHGILARRMKVLLTAVDNLRNERK
jgi:hypothetical protein